MVIPRQVAALVKVGAVIVSPRLLHSTNTFERGTIRDRERRTLQYDKVFVLEFAERARHGLAGRSDKLRDFLVSEREFDLCSRFGLFAVGRPVEQKTSYPFR